MIEHFDLLTEAEQQLALLYMQDLHQIPEDEATIPPGAYVSNTYSRDDPRLRSESYRNALYHVSRLKSLSLRGFENPELHFVLDLDKTLVHCIQDRHAENSLALTETMKRIKAETKAKEVNTVCYIQENTKQNWIVVIRPGLQEFLKKLMQISTLHICTQAELTYAKEIVKVIDPNRTYFQDRIYSQSMLPEKSLRIAFGANYESYCERTIIIDDQPAVWCLEDQPFILNSMRFHPLIKYDALSPTELLNQKTLYFVSKSLPPIREEYFDFSEAGVQFSAFVDILRHLHRKIFISKTPIGQLLAEFRHRLLRGRQFCLSTLIEPRKAEKKALLEYIIPALGGTVSNDEGTFVVEGSDPSGVPMSKVLQCWFMLKEL
mmetsp:Transcript_12333/g.23399  ORF Transcript_12333/g.23399 Transcript_12333/m.23399 type:complete len:376 (+) Transcript_12333:3-1130(+)